MPVIITTSLVLALMLELVFKIPVTALLVVFWFWRISLPARFWLSIIFGVVLHAVSILPFGTYIIIFLALALLTEALQHFFSNVRSPLTQFIGLGTAFLVFLALTPYVGEILRIMV